MPLLTLETEVADPLLRFAAGQDDKDEDLLASAFASDAVLDFRQPAGRFGAPMPLIHGREQIVAVIVNTTSHLETTHTITNIRYSHLSTRTASVEALIEAMHVDARTPSRRLLLKNRILVQLRNCAGEWKIEEMIFNNRWHEGEPGVLFAVSDKAVA